MPLALFPLNTESELAEAGVVADPVSLCQARVSRLLRKVRALTLCSSQESLELWQHS